MQDQIIYNLITTSTHATMIYQRNPSLDKIITGRNLYLVLLSTERKKERKKIPFLEP